MTDSELIERYINGEKEAFRRFYKKYKDSLYTFIIWKTDRESADDIFQAAFKKFIDVVVEKEVSNYKSYLFMIASNLIKNRGREKKGTSFSEGFHGVSKNELFEDMEKEVTIKTLKKVLKRLEKKKPELYSALYFHIFEEMSFEEVGIIENIKKETAKSRYRYAVKFLKENYEE